MNGLLRCKLLQIVQLMQQQVKVKSYSNKAVSDVMQFPLLVKRERLDPNLAAFGDRNRVAGFMDHTEEDLKEWITDPQTYKPGNLMPPFAQFSEEELDAIAEYLMGLNS